MTLTLTGLMICIIVIYMMFAAAQSLKRIADALEKLALKDKEENPKKESQKP